MDAVNRQFRKSLKESLPSENKIEQMNKLWRGRHNFAHTLDFNGDYFLVRLSCAGHFCKLK